MATKDRDELVQRAAQKLGIVGSGQSLEAEDGALIDDAVDALLSDLAARGVVYVADDEEIDAALFEYLAMLLANAVAEDFGKPMDAGKISFAEGRLRTIASGGPTYEVQKATYY